MYYYFLTYAVRKTGSNHYGYANALITQEPFAWLVEMNEYDKEREYVLFGYKKITKAEYLAYKGAIN